MRQLRLVMFWILRWIDDSVLAFARVGAMGRRGRLIQLIEQADGSFVLTRRDKRGKPTEIGSRLRLDGGELVSSSAVPEGPSVLAGSRAEVFLAPSRFVFRELELPARAADFLDGVVREQIDRLTPWRLGDAAYGWSAPAKLDENRIVVTIAATTRASIASLADALTRLRVSALVMSTGTDDAIGSAAGVRIFSQQSSAHFRVRRWRLTLIAGLGLSGAMAGAAVAAWLVLGSDLDFQRQSLLHEIAAREDALSGDPTSAPERALAALRQKKHAAPPDVLVIESLSRALPDTAYLTDLRIEDNKLQIAGLAGDAPGLIRQIEQTGHFSRVRFTAPTTSSPDEHGERFHLEANVEPVLTVTP